MEAFCPAHSAHARAIEHHDERLAAHARQIDEAVEARHQIEMALAKLTAIEEQNQQRIDLAEQRIARHSERLDALESQPAMDAKRVKDAALAAFGGAVGTGAVVMVAAAITQSI